MKKLDLTTEGKLFVHSMRACLKWLALGGEIKVKSGHTIMMDELGRPGFLVNRMESGKIPSLKFLMQLDSETVWSFVVDYARKMKEDDLMLMLSNLALNDRSK